MATFVVITVEETTSSPALQRGPPRKEGRSRGQSVTFEVLRAYGAAPGRLAAAGRSIYPRHNIPPGRPSKAAWGGQRLKYAHLV